jgi:SPP1 family predicted phage head-tail adaptor
MSLPSGKLRHRLSLEKRESTQDPVTGEAVFTWVEIARPWGSIEPLSVRDFIASKSQQSEVTGRIVIRYRTDINPQMRIVYKSTVYKIIGILPDPDSGVEYMTLAVSQGVTQG